MNGCPTQHYKLKFYVAIFISLTHTET